MPIRPATARQRGELSCYGNGRCPPPNEDCRLYPNSICICNGNYDPRTRCKTCLPGYRCRVWLHTVLRRPVQLQPAHEPGTMRLLQRNGDGRAGERGQSTARARQLQQGLPLCRCYDGYTAESGCRSRCSGCSGYGVCGFNQECKCDDGFQGMKCEIECPKHYGLHCNERACRTRDTYVLGGEMYVNRPCTTDQEAGAADYHDRSGSRGTRSATRPWVSTAAAWRNATAPVSLGPGVQPAGCPSHRVDYNYTPLTGDPVRVSRSTPCGSSPPDLADQGFGNDKTVYCPRGRCAEAVPAGSGGQYDYGTGTCVCLPSEAAGTNGTCLSSPDYPEAGRSCSGACVCTDKRDGVCSTEQVTSVGCTCRTDRYGGHLFGGQDCGRPCPGLCEWNQTALECTPVELGQFVYDVIGRNTTLMDACPAYKNIDSAYHAECYPNHSGCNRHGRCTGETCLCHGVYESIVNLMPQLSVFRVGRVRNMLIASGRECKQTCPYDPSRKSEFYDLVDWYMDNGVTLTQVATTESDRQNQIEVLTEYVTRYDSLFCSGHGSCTSTLVANDDTDEHVACECDDDFAGERCESKCNREPDIEAYFVEQGYSQQYNYVAEYASRVLKLGVCGVHASCRTRLSQPKCVANGQSQAALDSGFSRYTNVTRAVTEARLTNMVAGANVAQLYNTYGLMFVGPNVECAAIGDTHFYTHEPAGERYLPGEAVPDVIRWHDKRTCNGLCMINAVGQGLIDGNNDPISEPEAVNRGATFPLYVPAEPTAVAVASFGTPRCCATCGRRLARRADVRHRSVRWMCRVPVGVCRSRRPVRNLLVRQLCAQRARREHMRTRRHRALRTKTGTRVPLHAAQRSAAVPAGRSRHWLRARDAKRSHHKRDADMVGLQLVQLRHRVQRSKVQPRQRLPRHACRRLLRVQRNAGRCGVSSHRCPAGVVQQRAADVPDAFCRRARQQAARHMWRRRRVGTQARHLRRRGSVRVQHRI